MPRHAMPRHKRIVKLFKVTWTKPGKNSDAQRFEYRKAAIEFAKRRVKEGAPDVEVTEAAGDGGSETVIWP